MVRRDRRKRTPFGGSTLKMDIDAVTKERLASEGKVPAWINDVGGRIQEAQRGDYDFVQAGQVGGEDQEDSRISLRVGTSKHGEALNAYLMAIPKEYYDEDQDIKEERNKSVDRAIRGEDSSDQLGIDEKLGSATIGKVDYKP